MVFWYSPSRRADIRLRPRGVVAATLPDKASNWAPARSGAGVGLGLGWRTAEIVTMGLCISDGEGEVECRDLVE